MSKESDIKLDEVRELARDDPWPGGRDNTANILNEHRELTPALSDDEARRAMGRRSRRGLPGRRCRGFARHFRLAVDAG